MTPVSTLICCVHTTISSNDGPHADHGPASSIHWTMAACISTSCPSGDLDGLLVTGNFTVSW